jgi:hypothetical protein
MKTGLLTILLSIFLIIKAPHEDRDYQSIFGEDWQKAEILIQSNLSHFKPLADSLMIPYSQIIPIIFPELIRYSALQNKIEVSLLKTLYVYKGKDYADFSIGIFQMKPSFAEKIRSLAKASPDPSLHQIFCTDFNPENPVQRKQLVLELDNPVTEFIYLIAFFKLAEKIYKNKEWTSLDEKVRHYATLYNCGIHHSESFIQEMSRRKNFSASVLGPYYSYADIASFYFEKAFLPNDSKTTQK